MTPLSELIRKEKLDPQDPFCIGVSLFDDHLLNGKISPKAFYEDFYLKFLIGNHSGEILATDVYTYVQEIILDQARNQFQNINDEKIKNFINQLNDTLVEENEHEDYFKAIIETVYNRNLKQIKKFNSHLAISAPQETWRTWNDFARLLIFIYAAEVYVFSAYYLFYQLTTNQAIKKVLHKLIRDESQHNVRVYNFFKIIAQTNKLDSKYIEYMIDSFSQFKYFGEFHIEQILSNNNIRDINVEQFYNNTIQQQYLDISHKKWNKLLVLVNPDKNIKEYLPTIYNN